MDNKTWSLVGVPAVIALVVTIVRLMGELQGGSDALFSRAAGGAGALIGISWLMPVFGLYFGYRLERDGQGPASLGKAAGLSAAGIVGGLVLGAISGLVFNPTGIGPLLVAGFVTTPVVILLAKQGWPELTRALIGYGFLSRFPVAVIMLFAMQGAWGTHYDALLPGTELGSWFQNWVVFGAIPQLTIWIALTVITGGLFGAVGAVIARKRATA